MRTVTSKLPPEEPVSSQKSTSGRPRSPEVASMSSSATKKEIVNPKSPATQFGIIAGMFLRHTARSLGFRVLPDGYVRVSDMVNLSSPPLFFSSNFFFEPVVLMVTSQVDP